MYTIKCKNCGQANKITNIRCEFCNVELNHDAISKAREKVIKSRDKKAKNISDIIIALIFLPCLLVGLVLVGNATYHITFDAITNKYYLKTEGQKIDYVNCHNTDNYINVCNAVYKYNIDNKAYKYTTKDFGYAKAFGKTISLKYDSKHPDKAVTVSSKNYLVYLVIGLILIIINSLIYIFVRKSILRAIQTVTDLLTRNVEED